MKPVMSTCRRTACSLPIVVGYLVLAAGSEGPSQANCQLGTISVKEDITFREGPDAGYLVTFPIRNTGQDGLISLTVRLSTSEGTFTREQQLSLGANVSRDLSYAFHEPTINVTNVQARVSCTP